MRFDDILVNHLGQFGRYQVLQYILVGMPTIFTALHSLSWSFTAAKVKHRCLYPGENDTAAYAPGDQWHKDILNLTHDKDGCYRIANLSLDHYPSPGSNWTKETCLDGYAWDRSEMTLSAVGRWALVCGTREVIRPAVQSMYYVGQFFGSFIFGMLSDKIGRKPIFMIAIILQIACGAGMAIVPWWPLFAILRIGVGFAHPGIFVMAVVIGAELVGPKYRVVSSVGAGFFFALGEICLGALAYPIRDYRYLQLTISLPALIFLSYWWLVPESARWLMSRGRFEDADRILRRVAKCNGRDPLPDDWYTQIEKDKVRPHTSFKEAVYSLFRTPNLRKRTLITFFIWPVVSMCFYGLAINPAFLGGDNRIGFMIGGAMEFPGLVVVLFGLNFIGRKFLTCGGFLLATLCLLLTLAVPATASPYISLFLVVVGKSALTAVYATVYIMTPEHYPTIFRNTATGACSMIARAGGIAASFMSLYLADTYPMIVALVFAGLTFVAGIMSLLLPETTGEPLMETVEEAEAFGKDQPIFISGRGNQRLRAARSLAETETTISHS